MQKARSTCVCLALGCGLAMVPAQTALADIRHSENGGGQQIWITGDHFSARSGGATPHFIPDPNANMPLSGSAHAFITELGSESPGGSQEDWWVQYDIPVSSLPGGFNLTGEWAFWVHTQVPSGDEFPGGDIFQDSNWLFVNGDPADLNVSNPTEADWQGALAAATNDDDRILQDIVFFPTGARPGWAWVSGTSESARVLKTLSVVDGQISFRFYEREGGPFNGRVDVILFANDPAYVPSDSDYLNAVPEPGTLALFILGGAAAVQRRRRSRRQAPCAG